MDDERWYGGAVARAIAVETGVVPDPEQVLRVTYDGVPAFHYGDGRPAYELPGLQEAGE